LLDKTQNRPTIRERELVRLRCLSHDMIFILKLWALSLGLFFAAQGLQWLLFWLYKIKVDKIAIFYGKPLAVFHAGTVVIEIGWIPLGSYLKFDTEAFDATSIVGRTLILLSAPVLFILVGCALLGPQNGMHHYASGFYEAFNGALHPRTVATGLIGKLEAVSQVSIVAWWGIAAAKFAVMHSLPFGSLSAGMLVRHLVTRLAGQKTADLHEAKSLRWFAPIDTAGGLFLLVIVGSWYFALVVYAWRSVMGGG
jgi:hypothetical protein